eukprot:Lithocolla_globosa_v1_NODE_8517_length_812_cov_1.832232.p2 type:complete len:110 gc:universal NODE_8517_length_812_cov_1.832232:582-253(-)
MVERIISLSFLSHASALEESTTVKASIISLGFFTIVSRRAWISGLGKRILNWTWSFSCKAVMISQRHQQRCKGKGSCQGDIIAITVPISLMDSWKEVAHHSCERVSATC